MLTDNEMESVYNQIRWRIDKVNSEYLQMVAAQIKKIGALNPSSINKLAQMRIYGANVRKIKAELAKALNVSLQDVQRLLEKASQEEYAPDEFKAIVRGRSVVPMEYNYQISDYVEAIKRQTEESFENYSNTRAINAGYKNLVSEAIDSVYRGVTDYNSAIRSSLREFGGSGIRISYESGKITRRLDTAIRQNILDGVRQIRQKAREIAGEQYGADGVELSAHQFSALDHEPVQGRQFSLVEFEKMQAGLDFVDVDGNKYAGFKRPIGQWNCHHLVSYIIIGVSPRRYTDEQLRQYQEANHAGCDIDGKHYTIYQASQLMRQLETEVRKQRDIQNLAKASGDDVLRREAQAEIRDLKAKYKEVAEKSGLKPRYEKMRVEEKR